MIDQKDFWGPKLWKLIHTISYFSPDNLSKIDYTNYYYFYTFVIPRCIMCIKCQIHYRKMLERIQFDGFTKNQLIDYLIELHNNVNKVDCIIFVLSIAHLDKEVFNEVLAIKCDIIF